MDMTLLRHGNLIYVSPSGQDATPPAVVNLLHDHLTYDHRKLLFGWEAVDMATGQKRKVEVTEKRLYGTDGRGRLYTNAGFLHRLTRLLKQAGFTLRYVDLNMMYENKKGHARPERYKADLSNVTYHFKFREKQDVCIEKIARYPGGVIHAVTGFGKMAIIAMTCLLYPNARIHVVTKRLPLVNKISEYLTRYIPSVGQFGDGKRFFGDRVTVFCAKSLHHSDFDADLLLCDEAHELLADDASAQLARYQQTRNYAFSATPGGRMDGADIRMEALFGPVLFHLPYPEAQKLGLVVPIEVTWTNANLRNNPTVGCEGIERKRFGIWLNDERNDLISSIIKPIDQNEQVLTLTDTVYQAAEIYKRVRQQQRKRETVLVYDKIDLDRFKAYQAANVIPSDCPRMTPELKESYRKRFEAGEIDAIATTTWEVGIDPTLLQHLCVASSFASEIKSQQIPGRASRITTAIEKSCGHIYDIRDNWDRAFSSNSRSRYRVYESMGWTQFLRQSDGSLSPFHW